MVSKEGLLKDIENTKKEIDAYEQIVDGIKILRNLPSAERGTFDWEQYQFETALVGCRRFYTQLKAVLSKHYKEEKCITP